MAKSSFFGVCNILKAAPTLLSSSLNRISLTPSSLLSLPSRCASHTVLSSKQIIPPKPKQPRDSVEAYGIVYQNEPGGLKGWADWAMKKDVRRRKILMEWHAERRMIQTIRKNHIIPREIKEIADHEISLMPRYAGRRRLMRRCAISSRGAGVVFEWRLSRHFFRQFADYNKLSGVRRGIW